MSSTAIMSHDDHSHHNKDVTDIFGFWVYILTDCILFACLFATFIVLNSGGHMMFGPSLKQYINLDYVLVETMLLLASNFSFGLAIISLNKNKKIPGQLWLLSTFLLGAGFVGMELYEFIELIHEGYSFTTSGGASSFFTLVGTHGLHVTAGLIWIVTMMIQLTMFDYETVLKKRFAYLGLFWNFLDIVWIFLFSVVYLVGAL